MNHDFNDEDRITINGLSISSSEIDHDRALFIYSGISKSTEFENNLLNQRLTWALIISGSFIAAESFLGTSVMRDFAAQKERGLQGFSCFFMSSLSILAAAICLNSYFAIEAACKQLLYLRRFYEECRLNNKNLFEDALYLSRPFGLAQMHVMGVIQAKFIPPVLVVMWTLLTVIEFAAGVLFIGEALRQIPQPLQPK